ncbi:MAG TPA: lipopolysaccharide assembly protein LapA domain-containing protein [Streptosporangiaceae bacterium]
MVQRTATDNAGVQADRQGRRVTGRAIVALIGIALLIVVIIQNTKRIPIDFLLWTFVWPIWAFAIVMAVIGALTWFGLGMMRRRRRRKERRS